MAGLPWVRVDTNIPTHEKILELVEMGAKGKQAGFVYSMSIAYAGGHGTDGVIRKVALPWVHATPNDAKLLVQVGLWECAEGGFRIKNYGTRNAVGQAQQALSEMRSVAGKKGADARWSDD